LTIEIKIVYNISFLYSSGDKMIETQRSKDTEDISENPLSYKIIGAAIEVHVRHEVA
jgi:hypothetical protein